jgi:hypothetical protein
MIFDNKKYSSNFNLLINFNVMIIKKNGLKVISRIFNVSNADSYLQILATSDFSQHVYFLLALIVIVTCSNYHYNL